RSGGPGLASTIATRSADAGVDADIQARRLASLDVHRARQVARRIDAAAVQLDAVAASRQTHAVGTVRPKSDALDLGAGVGGEDHQPATGARRGRWCGGRHADPLHRLQRTDTGVALEIADRTTGR